MAPKMALSASNFSSSSNGTTRVANIIRKIGAPLVLKASDLSVSTNRAKTRTSISCRKTVPGSIDVSDEKYYHRLGGLDIINRDYPALEDYEWSTKQRKILGFCRAAVSHKLGHIHSYLAELWHVANPAPTFRPCILISTISPETMSALQAYLMRRPKFVRKLAECELDLHVVQSTITLSANPRKRPLDTGILATESNLSREMILAVIPGSRIVVTEELTGKTRNCVAGGVILAGSNAYILTSRHTWASLDESSVWCRETEGIQMSAHGNESATAFSIYHDRNYSDEAVTDSDSFDSDELLSSDDESSEPNIPSRPHRLRASPYADHTSSTPGDRWTSPSNERDLPPAHISMVATIATQRSRSPTDDNGQPESVPQTLSIDLAVSTHSVTADWVLASLSDVEQSRDVRVSNSVNGRSVTKFLDTSTSTLDVQLALPNGVVSGKLHPSTVYYTIGSHAYCLKAVTLQKPLGKGTSGAWVIHEDQLCGVVMAANPDRLEAFVLPIGDIVKDIERVCKASVSLPETHQTAGVAFQVEKSGTSTIEAQRVIEPQNSRGGNNGDRQDFAEFTTVSSQHKFIPPSENSSLLRPNERSTSCEFAVDAQMVDATDDDDYEEEEEERYPDVPPFRPDFLLDNGPWNQYRTLPRYKNIMPGQFQSQSYDQPSTAKRRRLNTSNSSYMTQPSLPSSGHNHSHSQMRSRSTHNTDSYYTTTSATAQQDEIFSPYNRQEQQPSASPVSTLSPSHQSPSQPTSKTTKKSTDKYVCDLCKPAKLAFFGTTNDLTRHRKSVHGMLEDGDKFWQCDEEGCASAKKMWPRRDNFQSHLKRMHYNGDDRKARENVDDFEQVYKSENYVSLKQAKPASGGPQRSKSTRSSSSSLPNYTNKRAFVPGTSAEQSNSMVNFNDQSPHMFPQNNNDVLPYVSGTFASQTMSQDGRAVNTSAGIGRRDILAVPPRFFKSPRSEGMGRNMGRPAGDARTAPPNPDSRMRQQREMQEQDEAFRRRPGPEPSVKDFSLLGATFTDPTLLSANTTYEASLGPFDHPKSKTPEIRKQPFKPKEPALLLKHEYDPKKENE